MSPDHAAVDGKQFPIDVCVVHLAGLQAPQNPVPKAGATPLAKPIVHGLPGTETLGKVTPSASVRKNPENAINQESMVLPLTTPLPIARQQISDLLPLSVRELVARRRDGHLALLGVWQRILPPSTRFPRNSPDTT